MDSRRAANSLIWLPLVGLLIAVGCAQAPPPTPTTAPVKAAATPVAPQPAKPTPVPAAAPGKEAAVATVQPAKVNLGYIAIVAGVGFFLAMDKGYFKEQNIEVEASPMDTFVKSVPLLATEQLHVAAGAPGAALFNAIGRDIAIKMVADHGTWKPGGASTFLMARKDLYDSGALREPKDLKGKRIALSCAQCQNEYAVTTLIEKAGLSAKDVEFIVLTHPDTVAALENKAVDAGVMVEPNAVTVESRGMAVRWISGDKLLLNNQNAAVYFSGPWAEKNPDVARRFMVAYLKAIRYYNDQFVKKGPARSEVIDSMIKWSSLKERPIYDLMVAPALNPNGSVLKDMVAKEQDWYVGKGFVKTAVDIDKLVDNQYAEYAVKQLGEYKN